MSTNADGSGEWLRPKNLLSCVDYLAPKKGDPKYWIYQAVVDGDVRARRDGRILTKEEASALDKTRWSDTEGDYYALPPDIELSAEDAKRIFETLKSEGFKLMIETKGRFVFGSYRIVEDMVIVTTQDGSSKTVPIGISSSESLARIVLRELTDEGKA
jgi:hypothetical protein